MASTQNAQFEILTVVSMSNNSFGFQDYNFSTIAEEVLISFNNEIICLENSLLAYNDYGRLTNPRINEWIQNNDLHTAIEPAKLVFKKQRNKGKLHYILYQTQANCLVNYFNKGL